METLLALIALFSVSLMLGGMVFFAAVVAPLVFTRLPFEQAGKFIRGMFPVYYVYVLATSAAASVAFFPIAKEASGIMAICAGVTLWLRQVLVWRINRASDLAQAGDAEAKRAFDRMHRMSVVVNVLQMVAAAAVLAMFAAA